MAHSDDEREAEASRQEAEIRADLAGDSVLRHNAIDDADARLLVSRIDAARAERDAERARAERLTVRLDAARSERDEERARAERYAAEIGRIVDTIDERNVVFELRMLLNREAAPPPPPSPNGARSAEEEREETPWARAIRLLRMLDDHDARHPDVAAFLDALDWNDNPIPAPRTAADERADVIAWLNEVRESGETMIARDIRDAIAVGVHVGTATKGGGG